MPRDTYADVLDEAGTSRKQSGRGQLVIALARLPAPHTIPPRKWLYGRILVEGYVSTLVAPGGVGKTAWSIIVGLAIASGRKRIGDWVYERRAVLVCTLEDPEDELDRRQAAAMIHHGIGRDEVAGYLHVISGRDRQLLMATVDVDGNTVCHPDKEALTKHVKALHIGVIVVDPFVNSHDLDENSNPHMNAAARAWAEVANDTGCAVLLVHHTRKGAVAGDIESARGAGAIIAASRVGLTLTAMSVDEASGFGIPEKDRRLHIRLDDGKANLAPPCEKARWFRLVGVDLHNGIPDTPWHHGDQVQTLVEWEPPATMQHDAQSLNTALSEIASGMGEGVLYTSSRTGKGGDRWAGAVLIRVLDVTDGHAAKMLAAWLKGGTLVEQKYYDKSQRKERSGLIVDNAKRPV